MSNRVNFFIEGCFKLLAECINFNHIGDYDFMCENLSLVDNIKKELPKRLQKDINKFILEKINPIINDPEYFKFLNKAEYGNYNSKGEFEINSDKSFQKLGYLLYRHTRELEASLEDVFSEYMVKVLLD